MMTNKLSPESHTNEKNIGRYAPSNQALNLFVPRRTWHTGQNLGTGKNCLIAMCHGYRNYSPKFYVV